jgi:hypothetical protein
MKTIEEKNRMISEFMGMQETKIGWYDAEENLPLEYTTDNTFDELLFNKSWDWLMPVVAKITRDEEFIDDDFRESVLDVVGFGRIDDTYRVVVEFIEMYNQQN